MRTLGNRSHANLRSHKKQAARSRKVRSKHEVCALPPGPFPLSCGGTSPGKKVLSSLAPSPSSSCLSLRLVLTAPVPFWPRTTRLQAVAAATAATEESDERQLANKCLKHSGRPKPDYTPCNLGRCYVNEYCYGGVCYGDEKCTYDLQCQEPRACQPSSGTCYNPPPGRALLDSPDRELNDQPPINKPDYTPCDDGDPDTYDDYCLGGTCVGYEPVCTGEWACEGDLPVCGGSDLCACSSTAEGEKFCWDGAVSCGDIPTCATSADCPSGAACIPNTCCGDPVCLYPCPAGGRALQDNGEGECVPTPISLCDR